MNIEELLRQTADQVIYPTTPEIRLPLAIKREMPRPVLLRWAFAVLLILLFAASLIAIPPVRAAVFDLLNIGAITIRVGESQPEENLPPLLDRATGRTTLEEAKRQVRFPIRLPAGWGEPDEVYVQEWEWPVVITIWRDPDHPNRIALALYHLDSKIEKFVKRVEAIEEPEVNGERAVWISLPHPLSLKDSRGQQQVYLVGGAVLIWEYADVTYRLETGLSMEEAVQIAESVR